MARARKRINADRLNTPGPRRRSLFPSIKLNSEVFGSFAETFARFMGTAGFLFGMTVFIVAWIVINNLVPTWFKDPFPYMLMTLMLSVQASYAAPLILLAQNRQEARDRKRAENDYLVNLKAELEIRLLHEKLDHLLHHQWERLLEIQAIQIEMLQGMHGKGTKAPPAGTVGPATDGAGPGQDHPKI